MSFQENNLYLLKHAGAPFTIDRLFDGKRLTPRVRYWGKLCESRCYDFVYTTQTLITLKL
jgi:hypothetical protein